MHTYYAILLCIQQRWNYSLVLRLSLIAYIIVLTFCTCEFKGKYYIRYVGRVWELGLRKLCRHIFVSNSYYLNYAGITTCSTCVRGTYVVHASLWVWRLKAKAPRGRPRIKLYVNSTSSSESEDWEVTSI